MSKRTRPRNLQALERRRRRHARRSKIGTERAFLQRLWAETFGPPPSLEDVATRIRRRLQAGRALFYEADYGLTLAEATSFPGAWSKEREFAGGKMKWRASSPTSIEVVVTPAPIAPHIEMSIGFANLPVRAVMDAATCAFCAACHDGVARSMPPFPECTSENGCRCVAAPGV